MIEQLFDELFASMLPLTFALQASFESFKLRCLLRVGKHLVRELGRHLFSLGRHLLFLRTPERPRGELAHIPLLHVFLHFSFTLEQ